MHLAGITEFLFDRGRGGRLNELTEARSSIRESPRGHLNTKRFQRVKDAIVMPRTHIQTSGIAESLHHGERLTGWALLQSLHFALHNTADARLRAGSYA
jgi:hypothetical protein